MKLMLAINVNKKNQNLEKGIKNKNEVKILKNLNKNVPKKIII